jgi:hypothetical protein
MISLAGIAISLIIGLVSVYGDTDLGLDLGLKLDWHNSAYMGELEKLKDYCFMHADRASSGEKVGNDLVKSGLINSMFYDWDCIKINEELQRQSEMAAWDAIMRDLG